MIGDILLGSETVTVKDVKKFVIKAQDLDLDAGMEQRPDTGLEDRRRALHHGPGDYLHINCNGDYRGGIRIFGPTYIDSGNLMYFDYTTFDLNQAWDTFFYPGELLAIGREAQGLALNGSYVEIDSKLFACGSHLPKKNPTDPEEDYGFAGLIVTPQRVEFDVESLTLNNPGIISARDPSRKALTHSMKDELIINSGKEYKGGLIIEGNVKINGTFQIGDMIFNPNSGAFSKAPMKKPKPDEAITDSVEKLTKVPHFKVSNISNEIKQLRFLLNNIQERLAVLESMEKSALE